MNITTMAILQIKASDSEIEEAERTTLNLVKDFMAAKPWAKKQGWTQAVNARFISYVVDSGEYADLTDIEKAVLTLNVGNASALRQWLEKEKMVEKQPD